MCLIVYHKDIKNVSFPSCSLATTSPPQPRLQFWNYFIYFLRLCASVGASKSEDTFPESVLTFYRVEAEVPLFLPCGVLHHGMCYTVWYTPVNFR